MKLNPTDTDSPYIPLISDYGFKVAFGNERNTLFLRRALQALIGSAVPIAEVFFDKNTFDGVVPDSRGGIYDLACVDETGRHFIVEMQLSDAPLFFHRMKFYAFHRYNLMVEKGQYAYDNLTPIYCIGILGNNLFPHADYHTIGTIRNQHGELLDDQITYVTVELDKFVKTADTVSNDLDKLIYTMKTIHRVNGKIQFPKFWDEEWLRIAIEELDRRKMTPEEHYHYVKTLTQNAESIRVVNAQIAAARKEAIEEGLAEGRAEGRAKAQREAVENLLSTGKLSPEEIAETLNVPLETVLEIRRKL